jgi:hypothetical protein
MLILRSTKTQFDILWFKLFIVSLNMARRSDTKAKPSQKAYQHQLETLYHPKQIQDFLSFLSEVDFLDSHWEMLQLKNTGGFHLFL